MKTLSNWNGCQTLLKIQIVEQAWQLRNKSLLQTIRTHPPIMIMTIINSRHPVRFRSLKAAALTQGRNRLPPPGSADVRVANVPVRLLSTLIQRFSLSPCLHPSMTTTFLSRCSSPRCHPTPRTMPSLGFWSSCHDKLTRNTRRKRRSSWHSQHPHHRLLMTTLLKIHPLGNACIVR